MSHLKVLGLACCLLSRLAIPNPALGQDAGIPARVVAEQVVSIRSFVGETPQWSPDGTQIAFLSSLGVGGGIWSVSPEGGFPTRLASDLGTGGLFIPAPQMPAWSPDGSWISYVSDKSGSPELWLWSARDGRHLQLTNLGGQRVNSYAWSPDGKWIAFGGNRYGNFDIWKVAVPSGEARRLTTDPRLEAFPSWAPDGQKLLYVRLDDRWMDHDVLEIDAAGSTAAPRLVTKDTAFFDYGEGSTFGYPMVSPDGRMVLFRSQRSGWINYWAAPVAGGAPRPIAAEEGEQSEARWSPDGKWIAFESYLRSFPDLFLMRPDGSDRRQLTDLGSYAGAPAWRPLHGVDR